MRHTTVEVLLLPLLYAPYLLVDMSGGRVRSVQRSVTTGVESPTNYNVQIVKLALTSNRDLLGQRQRYGTRTLA